MNTKKLFLLLAAVLLSSVSAFAQSGNNEPLKGDVNEDGTVDVADLVDVIKILKDAGGAVGEKMCYWYAGTNNGNAVTADNFTDVASRIPESEIPETGSVTAKGQYIYFVMPEAKYLESVNYANGSAVEFTCTDVMGYHIYKTSEMINTTINYTIKQTTYYYYAGWTLPTASNVDTIINETYPAESGSSIMHTAGKKTTSKSSMNYLSNTLYNPNQRTNYYVLVPTGHAIYDSLNNNVSNSVFTSQGNITVGNQTHTIYKYNDRSRNINAIIIK